MRIERLAVSSFGIFNDMRSPDFGPGLNVLYGENGAGKSTLLEFVRAVLFGFRTGKGAVSYGLAAGALQGGSIEVALADGRLVSLTRSPRGGAAGSLTATASDGSTVPLDDLLHGAGRDLFESVFAFSLTDIDVAGALNKGDLQNRIFAATAGTGAAAAPDIVARLNKDAEGIFKPNASNPELNMLLAAYRELASKRKGLLGGADRYARAVEALREAEARLAAAEIAQQEAEARQADLRRLSQAHPIWLAAETLRIRVEAHDGPDSIPPDAERRLDAIEADQSRRAEALAKDEGRMRDLTAEMAGIAVDERLLERQGDVDDLVGRKAAYDAARDALPTIESGLASEEGHLASAVHQLGPGWDLHRLTGHVTTVEITQGVAEWAAKLTRAEADHGKAQSLADSAAGSAAGAESSAEAALAAFAADHPGAAPDHAEIEARQADVAATRQDLNERVMLELQLKSAEGDVRQAEANAADPAAAEAAEGRIGLWVVPLQAAAIILCTLLMGATPAAAAVAAAAVVALGIGAYRLQRAKAAERASAAARSRQSDAAVQAARAEVDRIQREISVLGRRVEERAGRLGLSVVPSLTDLDEKASALNRLVQAAQLRIQAQATLRGQVDTAKSARAAADQLANQAQAAAQALQAAQDGWQAWIGGHGIDTALSPAGVDRLLQGVASAKQIEALCGRLRAQKAAEERTISQVMTSAAGLASELEEAAPTAAACSGMIAQWQSRMREADLARTRLAGLQAQRRGLESAISTAQQALVASNAALADLLAEAECGSAAELRDRIGLYVEREQLKREHQQHRTRLLVLYGTAEALEADREQLTRIDAEGLAALVKAAEDEVARRRTDTAGIQQDVGRNAKAVEDLETASDLERTGLQLADTQRQMQEAADRWIVLRTCEWLMGKAIKVHETTRQPEVLRLAGEHLKAITAGSYRGMFTPAGQKDVVVMPATGEPKISNLWNRGLKEQTYLALRLGFIQNYCASSEPLPIVIDDVLANSDPDHGRRAAERLCEMAEALQIIYLTCHPETVDGFRSIAGNAATYMELGDRKLRELPAA